MRKRVRFNKTTEPIYLIRLICFSVQNSRWELTVKELMQTPLFSMEAILARASLWTEPSIASTHLNCSTEGVTEGLFRPGQLLARCYGRDERQLHRAERGT
jgi:hypothetical protein